MAKNNRNNKNRSSGTNSKSTPKVVQINVRQDNTVYRVVLNPFDTVGRIEQINRSIVIVDNN